MDSTPASHTFHGLDGYAGFRSGQTYQLTPDTWDDVHQAVQLCQVPASFLVELNYDVEKNEIEFLYAFEAGGEDDRLPDYAMFVKLPDWLLEVD